MKQRIEAEVEPDAMPLMDRRLSPRRIGTSQGGQHVTVPVGSRVEGIVDLSGDSPRRGGKRVEKRDEEEGREEARRGDATKRLEEGKGHGGNQDPDSGWVPNGWSSSPVDPGQIESFTDPERIEALTDHLLEVASWDVLLAGKPRVNELQRRSTIGR